MDEVEQNFGKIVEASSQSKDWSNLGHLNLAHERVAGEDFVDPYMVIDYSDAEVAAGRTHDFNFSFNQRVVVACIYCFIAITGLTGNSCVVLAVLLSKKLHNLTNVLIVNLSVTDFLTCVTMLIQAATLLTSDEKLQIPKGLCTLASILNFVCICSSLLTLTMIAFMRWYVITRGIRGHQGLHTPRKLALMLVCSWTLSILAMLLPPAFGIGTFGYSVGFRQCFTTDDNELSVYYGGMQGIGCVVFIVLAVSFYVGIFRHVRKNNISFIKKNGSATAPATIIRVSPIGVSWQNPRNDIVFNQQSPKHNRLSVLTGFFDHGEGQMAEIFRKRELSITKNLLVVFCIFVVCFVPAAISLLIPGESLYQIYTMVFLYISACINPFVYGLKHEQFKEVLKPLVCCRCSEIPEPTRLCRKNRKVVIDHVAVAMSPEVECFSKYFMRHHQPGQAYTL